MFFGFGFLEFSYKVLLLSLDFGASFFFRYLSSDFIVLSTEAGGKLWKVEFMEDM